MLQVNCPHCRQRLQAPESAVGQVLACPHCKKHLRMGGTPSTQQPAPASPPSLPPMTQQPVVTSPSQHQPQAANAIPSPVSAKPFAPPAPAPQQSPEGIQQDRPQPPPFSDRESLSKPEDDKSAELGPFEEELVAPITNRSDQVIGMIGALIIAIFLIMWAPIFWIYEFHAIWFFSALAVAILGGGFFLLVVIVGIVDMSKPIPEGPPTKVVRYVDGFHYVAENLDIVVPWSDIVEINKVICDGKDFTTKSMEITLTDQTKCSFNSSVEGIDSFRQTLLDIVVPRLAEETIAALHDDRTIDFGDEVSIHRDDIHFGKHALDWRDVRSMIVKHHSNNSGGTTVAAGGGLLGALITSAVTAASARWVLALRSKRGEHVVDQKKIVNLPVLIQVLADEFDFDVRRGRIGRSARRRP